MYGIRERNSPLHARAEQRGGGGVTTRGAARGDPLDEGHKSRGPRFRDWRRGDAPLDWRGAPDPCFGLEVGNEDKAPVKTPFAAVIRIPVKSGDLEARRGENPGIFGVKHRLRPLGLSPLDLWPQDRRIPLMRLSLTPLMRRGALVRVLPIAVTMGLGLGAGCKKKDKKVEPKKDAAAALEKAKAAAKKQAAPVALNAASGADWMGVVSLMPDGVNSVLGINVDKIRKTPFWKDIRDGFTSGDQGKELMAAMKRCGLGEADLSRMGVGGGVSGFGTGVVAISGKGIGNKTKVKCLLGEAQTAAAKANKDSAPAKTKKDAAKAKVEFFKSTQIGGKDAFEIDPSKLGLENQAATPDGKMFVVLVDENRVALAPQGMEKGLAARLKPGAEPISRTLAGLKDKVSSSGGAIMVLGYPDRNLRHMLEGQGVKGIKSYRASVDLSKGVGLNIDLAMRDATLAKESAKVITTKVNEQKPMLGFLSLPPTLLDSLKVQAKGTDVQATLKLTEKEVGAVRSMMEKQAAAGQAGNP